MIREIDYERSAAIQPLAPTARPRIDPYTLITLNIAVRFIICLAAIWMGIQIAAHAPNEGIAVIAALACGGVIYGLLGRAR